MTRRDRDRLVADLTAERDRLQAVVDATHAAHVRGAEMWRAGYPERAMVLPDAAGLVTWLMKRVADLEAEVAGLRSGMAEAMVPHLRQMEAGDYVNGGDMLDDVCAAAGIDKDAVRRASEDERRRWEDAT